MPAFPWPLLRRRSWLEWLFYAVLLLCLAVSLWSYYRYVDPWIEGTSNIRFGADSDRYWEYARAGDGSLAVSLSTNFFGPVLLAMAVKSGLGVMLVNIGMFLLALRIAFSIPHIDRGLVGLLLVLNPAILPALTTLNKEIFVLLASVMTAKYFYSGRSRLLLAATLLLLLCARWEMVAVLVLYLLACRLGLRDHPGWLLILVIAGITVAYPFAFRVLGVDPIGFDYLLSGAGTILVLDRIQVAFGFPLVLVPKALMLLVGTPISPRFYTDNMIFDRDFADYQQGIFQPLACLALVLVLLYAWRTGRLSLARPIAVLSYLTLILTAASPFIQSRYIYGIYVLLAVDIARPRELGEEAAVSAPPPRPALPRGLAGA
jgi:hypothetical protein